MFSYVFHGINCMWDTGDQERYLGHGANKELYLWYGDQGIIVDARDQGIVFMTWERVTV